MNLKIAPVILLILTFIALSFIIILPASALEPVHNASPEYLVSQYHANLQSVNLTGDQRTDVLLVALSQLGYHEGDNEGDMGGGNDSGSRNFVEYNRLFGKVDNFEGNGVSYGYAWCCAFATWCIRQAGVPVSVLKTEVSNIRLIAWLKENSTYKTRASGYIPESGDLIFFKNPTSSSIATHVGLVRYVSGSYVYTIEGNPSSNNVALKNYSLSDTYIVGYGVPAYTKNPSAAIDFSMSGGYLPGTYFINTTLNVRSGPSTSHSQIGGLSYRDKVTVTDSSGGWGKIDYKGKEGWIYLGYAQYVPSARFTIYYDTRGGSIVPSQPKADGVGAPVTSIIPVKAGYNFIGWSSNPEAKVAEYIAGSVITADADTTLYAVFTTGEFTVSFYDGQTMLLAGSFKNGAEVTQPLPPTKEPDQIYKYVFAGWDSDADGEVDVKAGEKITATQNAVYRAVFDKEYIEYKVTFYGRDQLTPLFEKVYRHGDTVEIPTPVDYREGAYAYTFTGWDTPVEATVKGSASYIALYDVSEAIYSVSFIDGNGKQIGSGEYKYGEIATAPEATPEKNPDKTYTYTFSDWSPALGTVLADTVYTAQFSKTYIDYKISFIDGDGNLFHEFFAHYKDTIEPPDTHPTKSSDEIYDYIFTGWDREIEPVSADTVYNAVFDSTLRVYAITFFNSDGTVYQTAEYNYGDTIIPPADPVKASPLGVYTFTGWYPELTSVKGNMNFTAQFSFKADITTKPGDNDSASISPGTIISIIVVTLAAAAFVAYITIRGRLHKGDEP